MYTFDKKNIVFKERNHLIYQLSNSLAITAKTQVELKIIIYLVNRLFSEKKLTISKFYLKRISIDYLEPDTWAECDPDNKTIVLNRVVLDDLLREGGYKKRSYLLAFKELIYQEFGVYLIHEYVHCIDYNSDFSFSETILNEFIKAINRVRRKTTVPSLFNFSKKEDILFECAEGLPNLRKMSPKAFYTFHQKHKKIVKDLGYVTPYSLTSPQEFVAEHLAFFITNPTSLDKQPKLRKIIKNLSYFITHKIC